MSTAARSRYGSRAVRTISILVLIAAATTRLAIAGPNAGGTLVIHADPDVVYSPDIEYCGFGTLPASCAEVNTRVDGTATTTWHVFAAFPENSHPRLAGVAWGVTYDPDRVVVVDWGGCGDFELPNSGWPAPGEGTAVTWGVAQTATFTEIYWFAGYVYAAEATSFDLTLHPQQGGSFVDDSVPGSLDPIADFGELGFNGNPGYLPCPDPLPGRGACCFPDGTCRLTTAERCDGEFLGEGTVCVPNDCPQPPEGACCFPNGSCVVENELLCNEQHGTFFVGEVCVPNPCEQPPEGACCLPDGTCFLLDLYECDLQHGDWLGEDTSCIPNPCPTPLFGACCYPDGACREVFEYECAGAGGHFYGDSPCADVNCIIPCPQPRAVAAGAPAVYGPNAGGTLLLHSDPSLVYTTDVDYCGASGVRSCDAVIPRTDSTDPAVIHVLAYVPGGGRLVGVVFGVSYPDVVLLVDHGACGDFELPDGDWPASDTGTAVTWGTAQTSSITEVYWFAGLSYYPALLCLGPHPAQGAFFADDSVPAILDPIVGLGVFGFGTDGYSPCPTGPLPGACCFADGVCRFLLAADCEAQGGVFQGQGTVCEPNPCPTPAEGACCLEESCIVATEEDCAALGGIYLGDGESCEPNPCGPTPTIESSWGRVKVRFQEMVRGVR